MELHRAEGRVVLPVFYGVEPYDVRHQKGYFESALEELILKCSPTEDQVSRWRTDLREAGNIMGFEVINSRNESEEIKNIVDWVCEKLDKKGWSIANHPVGVNSRMQDVIKMSESHPPNDVLQQLGKRRTGGHGSKYDRARYDVFLSFNDQDTRASFIAHLYSFLSNAGILVYKDDANFLKGLDIQTESRRGIECSTISIIIFSRNYACSPCLKELSIII